MLTQRCLHKNGYRLKNNLFGRKATTYIAMKGENIHSIGTVGNGQYNVFVEKNYIHAPSCILNIICSFVASIYQLLKPDGDLGKEEFSMRQAASSRIHYVRPDSLFRVGFGVNAKCSSDIFALKNLIYTAATETS
jgi:hypothetical protein